MQPQSESSLRVRYEQPFPIISGRQSSNQKPTSIDEFFRVKIPLTPFFRDTFPNLDLKSKGELPKTIIQKSPKSLLTPGFHSRMLCKSNLGKRDLQAISRRC